MPYSWNSTVPPVMCSCPKSLAWECPRCKKINAPWKGSCDCTPSPLIGTPSSGTQPYNAGPVPFNAYFTDPTCTDANFHLNKNFTDK